MKPQVNTGVTEDINQFKWLLCFFWAWWQFHMFQSTDPHAAVFLRFILFLPRVVYAFCCVCANLLIADSDSFVFSSLSSWFCFSFCLCGEMSWEAPCGFLFSVFLSPTVCIHPPLIFIISMCKLIKVKPKVPHVNHKLLLLVVTKK